MKNENDLRVLKTRKAIIESFLEILAHKPYEDISVTEICQKAQCSRNTFYLHFPYKEALYDSIMNDYVKKICECIAIVDEIPTENLDKYFVDLMSEIGDSLLAQRKHIMPILIGEHSSHFFERVTDEVRKTLLLHSEHLFPNSSNNNQYRLICWYSASAMVGFLKGCINDVNIKESEAKELFAKIHSLVSELGARYLREL